MVTGCRRTWGRIRALQLIPIFLRKTTCENMIGASLGRSPVRGSSTVPITWWLRLLEPSRTS